MKFLQLNRLIIKSLFTIILLTGTILAQDFSDLKICINPGHGGHDSDDRFIPQTGFYESDGNLAKGLHLRDILESMGANIIMTRTENRSADDLPLSQIVSIANSNNVDYMHAIHSNGFNGQLNYTLILFQGFDNGPTYPLAKVMAGYLGTEIKAAHRTIGGPHVRGDFDFYGTGQPYLGVFRNLNMPGTLSEGSFHDYIPESWRLKSSAYAEHEAWAIAKSFIKLYNKEKLNTGFISGIVRDADQNVNYFYLSNSNDQKKPVNNIKVRLEPGGRIFRGDDQNNGFFLFDSVSPGQYTVHFETEGYSADSVVVNVAADQNSYADAYVVFNPEAPPVVLDFAPHDTTGGIYTTSPIQIEFNRQMNRTSTENAFSIEPSVQGSFSWQSSDKILLFTPAEPLDTSTTYTVTIESSALSNWNVPLDSVFSFSFTTKNRSKLNLVSSYPLNGEDEVSTTVQIRLEFDGPVVQTSTQGQVALFNSARLSQSVKNIKFFNVDSKGYIYFEPGKELNEDSSYYVELRGGIKDEEGFILKDTVQIHFTTLKKPEYSFSVIDAVDSLGQWIASVNMNDSAIVSLSLASDKKISGSYSAKLNYQFNKPETGSVEVLLNKKISVSRSDTTLIGLWIFGDNSGNIVEFKIGDLISAPEMFVDTLNWTGWKLKQILLPEISSEQYFSFLLKKNSEGTDSSEIYFDELVYNSTVTNVEESGLTISGFALYQNYPNPFNPGTIIRYTVPQRSKVTLKIFDTLGREVAELVNEMKDSGTYAVEFNADDQNRNLASGVYFYSLNAEGYTLTKKLVLLK